VSINFVDQANAADHYTTPPPVLVLEPHVLVLVGLLACWVLDTRQLDSARVMCHMLYSVYDTYSFHVIPVMGQVIAADWKSYRYLVESIRQFPPQVRVSCCYSSSLAVWDHTVLPATRHKWTRPT